MDNNESKKEVEGNEGTFNDRMLFLCLFVFCQIIFFAAASTIVSCCYNELDSTSLSYRYGFIFDIIFSSIYATLLIVISKKVFTKEKYGSFISNSVKISRNNILVVMIFIALYLVYPVITSTEKDIPLKEYINISFWYCLAFFIDIFIQILILWLKEKTKKEKAFDIVLYIFQLITLFAYFSIIIPSIFYKKSYILIAFGITILATTIYGIILWFINKKISKKEENSQEYSFNVTFDYIASVLLSALGGIGVFYLYTYLMIQA